MTGVRADHSLSGTELIQKLVLVLAAVADVGEVLNAINNVPHFLGVVKIFCCTEETSIAILKVHVGRGRKRKREGGRDGGREKNRERGVGMRW